jgi:hypothetical protein
MESVMILSNMLSELSIKMEFVTITFESLIPRARNACACHFLNSSCTHILFIDADIMFNPKDVIKMILHKKHIVAGSYPKKALKFDLIKEAASSSSSMSEFISKSVNYASNFKKDGEVNNALVEVLDAPTGFMLIARPVFIKLVNEYPEIKYTNDIQAYKLYEYKGHMYDFFQSCVIEGRYLSEDYGFCRLYQKIENSKIFIDFSVQLVHIGQFYYFGNPLYRYFEPKE